MNANTKTIKARRVNNAETIGKHQTLLTVRNDPGKHFAFAITDDGEEVYIPASIVRSEQMTSADEGAGFSCPVKPNPRALDEQNTAVWIGMRPIKWDGEAEEIEVEVNLEPEIDPQIVEDHERLVVACSQFLDNVGGPLQDTMDKADKMIKGMSLLIGDLKKQRAELNKLGNILDEVAPEND